MPRRVLEGNVVSAKTDKTITVLVERRIMHPVYKKFIRRTDKYAAHDENNQCQVGDRVRIIECRPISKTKRWTVLTDGTTATPAPRKKAEKPATEATAEAKKAPAAKKPAAKKTTAKKKDA